MLLLVSVVAAGAQVTASGRSEPAAAARWLPRTQAVAPLLPPVRGDATLAAPLAQALRRLPEGDRLDVVVHMTGALDPRQVAHQHPGPDERVVIEALRARARARVAPLLDDLAPEFAAGTAQLVRRFWVLPGVALSADPGVVRAVAARTDVASVSVDRVVRAPTAPAATGPVTAPAVAVAAEPNLDQVGAPALWGLGLTGQGVVVASMDTGVDGTHPDLSGRWRGGDDSWYDPYGEHPQRPTDVNGHGTWTTGVMVGGDAGGSSVGMAPGARWIAVKAFDDRDRATTSALHASFEWLLDPDDDPGTPDAPDVVNASWAMSTPGCDLEFQGDLRALRAIGVLPVFAAGNSGPGPGSDHSPANLPEALAAGAVDSADTALDESSRGPSTCGGRARVFPDQVAPGDGVVTSDLFGTWTAVSGTSLAAPHVAGALALLLSGRPSLTAAEQQDAVVAGGTDLGPSGADETYGSGRLEVADTWRRLAATDTAGPGTADLTVTPGLSNLSTPPVLAAAADDAGTGGSSVLGAELFVDAAGPPGSGLPLDVFDAGVRVGVRGSVPTDLPPGRHLLLVHARDAAGNWGPTATATLDVDTQGPVVGPVSVSPQPSNGTPDVDVGAVVTDTGNGPDGAAAVAAATAAIVDPAWPGGPVALRAQDGAYGQPVESVQGRLDVAGARWGQYRVAVRASDAAGNQGAETSAWLDVLPADGLFSDGWETGRLDRWAAVVRRARLSVRARAAHDGARGLSVDVTPAPVGLVDASPQAESSFRARWWLAPGTARTAAAGRAVVEALDDDSGPVASVLLRRTARQCSLGIATITSTGRMVRWVTVTDGPHAVEVGLRAGAPAELWVDGVLRRAVDVPSAGLLVDTVRVGVLGDAATASGRIGLDSFVTDRTTPLGG